MADEVTLEVNPVTQDVTIQVMTGGGGTVTSVDVVGTQDQINVTPSGAITGAGTKTVSLAAAAMDSLDRADSAVQSVVAGTGIAVDNTDFRNPVISTVGGGGDVFGPSSASIDNLPFFDSVTGKSIADSGIAYTSLLLNSGSYANPSWLTSLAWSKITGTPTTLAGYGITNAQPLDATLTALAGLSTSANQGIYATGTDAFSMYSLTAGGRALGGVAGTADTIPYFSASDTVSLQSSTSYGRGFLPLADAAAARTYVGLGNVENTALSTWAGSSNLTTVGTLTAPLYIDGALGTGQTILRARDTTNNGSISLVGSTTSIVAFLQGSFGTTLKFNDNGFQIIDSGNTGNTLFSYDGNGLHASRVTSFNIGGVTFQPLIMTGSYFPISTSTAAISFRTFDSAGSTDQNPKLEIFNGDDGPVRARWRLEAQLTDAATSTVTEGRSNIHLSSGTVATGFGVRDASRLQNASGVVRLASAVDTVYTDAANATEDAEVIHSAITAGSLAEVVRFSGSESIKLPYVITPPGTVGDRTINAPRGRVNFASGAMSLTVTNSFCRTTSHVSAAVFNSTSDMESVNVIPSNGSFILYARPTVPNVETAVSFLVIN